MYGENWLYSGVGWVVGSVKSGRGQRDGSAAPAENQAKGPYEIAWIVPSGRCPKKPGMEAWFLLDVASFSMSSATLHQFKIEQKGVRM